MSLEDAPDAITSVKASSPYYRPELDVLRFVAFLMVFLHHAFPRIPSGYQKYTGDVMSNILSAIVNSFGFGLCLFFFLSAYLITTLLLKEVAASGTIHLRDFYARRILRIWPLYALGLLIMLVWALLKNDHEQLRMLVYYVTFVGNWYYLNHPWGDNPMTPLWSISVEEQFYLVLPLAMGLLKEKHLMQGGGVVAIVSLASLFWQGHEHRSVDTEIWVNTTSQMIFFASGVMLAAFTRKRYVDPSKALRITLIIVAPILFFVAAYGCEVKKLGEATTGLSIAIGYLIVMLGCITLVLSVLNISYRFSPLLIYLGKISFGLYVFHLFSMWVVEAVLNMGGHHVLPTLVKLISLPLTIALASFSYRYFEMPFLRLKKRFTYVENRPD